MSETINGVSILSAETKRALVADVQFFETYTSAAFNRKMRGIVKPGFYAGFDAVLAGGLKINITSANESGKRGVASVDVGEYQISVQQVEDIGFTLPAGATTRVVLEANYQNGVKTNQVDSNSGIQAARLFLADVSVALAGNQLELCRFTVPSGTTNLTLAMLSKQNRPDKSIGIELSNDVEGSSTEGDAYKATTVAALKRALALSVQARGELPDTANLNRYGPTADRVGQWSKSTVTGATIANGYPENDAIGVVEISKAGASNGTQRITLLNGNVYTRSLTAAWNGTDGPWGAWSAPYEETPLPDVWLPLNDSLTLLAGSGPYDRITFGDQYAELATRSAKFVRATTATYIDKSGVLRTADVNEPRFEKDGLLMEGWGTNHVLYSAETTKWRSSFAEDVGIAQSDVLAPDGESLAGKVSFLTTNTIQATISANIENYAGFTTGGFVTTSFFVKPGERSVVQIVWPGSATGVSSAYANFDLVNMTMRGTCVSCEMQVLAGGWIRCTATALIDGDMSGAGSVGAWIGIINSLSDSRRPQVSGVVGEGFYVWGAQMEAQRIATSYIPTAGISATRLGETATLSADCNAGYATAGDLIERTTAIEFSSDRLGLAAGSTVTALQVAGITNDLMLRFSATELLSYRGSSVIRMPVTHPISKGVFVQTIDKNNQLNMHFGGKKVGNKSIPTSPSQKPTTINITSVPTCSYHVRNIRIWHRTLNENQVKGIR